MKCSILLIIILVTAGLATIALQTRARTSHDRQHAIQIKGTFLASKCEENSYMDWNDVQCWEFSNSDDIDPGVLDLIIVGEILFSLLILFLIYTYCIKLFSPNANSKQGIIFTAPAKLADVGMDNQQHGYITNKTGEKPICYSEILDAEDPPAYAEIDKPPAYMLVNTFEMR